MAWTDQPAESAYPVDILVKAGDRKGLLRDISSLFTNDDIDVTAVKTVSDRHKERASMRFTVEINNIEQLSRIIDRISQIPDVFEVHRQM